MSDPLDIQNLLQTGYFTTSRAKSPRRSPTRPESTSSYAHAHAQPPPPYTPVPRTFEVSLRRKRSYPPAPFVEDEATSLKREHGQQNVKIWCEDEPPSRGEIDQNPIIMEVFEYNPERRFVFFEKRTQVPPEAPTRDRKRGSEAPPPPNGKPPSVSAPDIKPSEPKVASSRNSANLKVETSTHAEDGRPRLEKRRSRQDLPRLETGAKADQQPQLSPGRSSRQPTRSDYPPVPPPRQSRPYAEQNLSPEVIKHGSSGRETAYYGYSQSQSGDRRVPTHRTKSEDRRTNDIQGRGSSTPSTTKRVDEPIKQGRPLSNDRINDPRYRSEHTAPRGSREERPRTSGRDDSKYSSRDSAKRSDDSRSGDEKSKTTHELPRRPRESIVIQDGRDTQSARPKPQGPKSFPTGPSENTPVQPRNASTFPIARESRRPTERDRPQTLPYPDDDDAMVDPLSNPFKPRGNPTRSSTSQYDGQPPVAMPELPYPIAIGPETPIETKMGAMASSRPPVPPKPWQPEPFEPNQTQPQQDKPTSGFRRFSENSEAVGAVKFPECRRKHPVQGKMDWLTLPRTDFNICPECYETVFGNTMYRTQFVPLLRPSDKPISCDFGSIPWYRIAWLLTLKNKTPDLRLFHQLANIMTKYHNQPCPGRRATVRNWLTVINPHTRRPVYDFAVCAQCAGIVEALLPNLAGLFEELSPRAEQIRTICAMRFEEKRKRFVAYFDAMEDVSQDAFIYNKRPDYQKLADDLEKMTRKSECQEDTPLSNGYWHVMQFLPQFSVCGDCFEEVVEPLIRDNNMIARNFYPKPQKIAVSTCQLYSPRMRDIFAKASRWDDAKYLEAKVIERLQVEADIHKQLARLTNSGKSDEWIDEEVDKLIREWKKWE